MKCCAVDETPAGKGRAASPPAAPSPPPFRALLRELDLAPATLVGHSCGGVMGRAVAAIEEALPRLDPEAFHRAVESFLG